MCGRYAVYAEEDTVEMKRIMQILNERFTDTPAATGEIFPTNPVPVLAQGKRVAVMRWGLEMLIGGKKKNIINVRAETALDKPLFRTPLASGGRCLFPASAYFEWMALPTGEKQRCRFTRADGGLLYMAGLFLPAKEQAALAQASILTTAANASVSPCHNRMPLILPAALCRDWLEDATATKQLLAYQPDEMRMEQGA